MTPLPRGRWTATVLMVAVAAICAGMARAGTGGQTEQPETVIVRLHARAGSEADVAGVIARHWDTAHRLNLVLATPHRTVRGTGADGRTYFVDIVTWRDGSVPDHVPAEIQKIWAELNRLSEPRNGHPGLEFSEVSIVGN